MHAIKQMGLYTAIARSTGLPRWQSKFVVTQTRFAYSEGAFHRSIKQQLAKVKAKEESKPSNKGRKFASTATLQTLQTKQIWVPKHNLANNLAKAGNNVIQLQTKSTPPKVNKSYIAP